MSPVTDRVRGVLSPVAASGKILHERVAASEPLRGVVQHFWSVRWDLRGAKPFVPETLPHPNVHWVFDAEGARTLRWTWRVDPARAPLPTKPTTFVLGHRRSYRTFKHGAEERPAATVAFRIGLTTERGRAGSVVLHKAAALRA